MDTRYPNRKGLGEMRNEFTFIENFKRFWEILPKWKVWCYDDDSRCEVVFKIAFELGGLYVVICAIIGPRGGLKEEVYALDLNQRIEIERLVCNARTSIGQEGLVLPLYEMRAAGRKGFDLEQLCYHMLECECKQRFTDAEWTDLRLMEIRQWRGDSKSLRAVQGGLPGLGKRA